MSGICTPCPAVRRRLGEPTEASDLAVLLLLGLLGFAKRRYGLPVLPLVIGVILGPRAEEVLDAAEEHRADLSVIGLRRRTAVGQLIMGSTAQRILRDAQCPALAVKAAHA